MPADEQSGCFPRSEKTEIGKYRFFLRYERRDAAGAAELLSVILSSEESVSMMKGEGNPGGRFLSFAVRKKLPGERKLFIEVV